MLLGVLNRWDPALKKLTVARFEPLTSQSDTWKIRPQDHSALLIWRSFFRPFVSFLLLAPNAVFTTKYTLPTKYKPCPRFFEPFSGLASCGWIVFALWPSCGNYIKAQAHVLNKWCVLVPGKCYYWHHLFFPNKHSPKGKRWGGFNDVAVDSIMLRLIQ